MVLSGWIMSIELEAEPSSLLLFFLFFFADLSSSDMVTGEARQGRRPLGAGARLVDKGVQGEAAMDWIRRKKGARATATDKFSAQDTYSARPIAPASPGPARCGRSVGRPCACKYPPPHSAPSRSPRETG